MPIDPHQSSPASGPGVHFGTYESRRFGFPVFRASAETLRDAEASVAEARASQAELLILRFPPDACEILQWLGGRPGWYLGDTLVHYRLPVVSFERSAPLEGFRRRAAVPADADDLARLAARMFRSYVSHYRCNPRTNAPEKIVAGYVEWCLRSVLEPSPRAFCLLVESEADGEIAAYANLEIYRDVGHIVLGGVNPGFQGGGVYRVLIEHCIERIRESAGQSVEISTQAHNLAVQKVWTRLGFSIFRAETTVHLDLRPGGFRG